MTFKQVQQYLKKRKSLSLHKNNTLKSIESEATSVISIKRQNLIQK